jgi:hypothetical protein
MPHSGTIQAAQGPLASVLRTICRSRPVTPQDVKLAELQMGWANIDRNRADCLLVEDDDLPRLLAPTP